MMRARAKTYLMNRFDCKDMSSSKWAVYGAKEFSIYLSVWLKLNFGHNEQHKRQREKNNFANLSIDRESLTKSRCSTWDARILTNQLHISLESRLNVFRSRSLLLHESIVWSRMNEVKKKTIVVIFLLRNYDNANDFERNVLCNWNMLVCNREFLWPELIAISCQRT